jgi:hypothetical protein
MTRSETRKTFATFRVSGDALDPNQVTRILRLLPTIAYAKGQQYFAGERIGHLTGKTGIWLFSTENVVASDALHDHLFYIVGMFVPERQNIIPLTQLRALMARRKLHAELSAFWHGLHGTKHPPIPKGVSEVMKLLPADIEIDFATDQSESERRRA